MDLKKENHLVMMMHVCLAHALVASWEANQHVGEPASVWTCVERDLRNSLMRAVDYFRENDSPLEISLNQICLEVVCPDSEIAREVRRFVWTCAKIGDIKHLNSREFATIIESVTERFICTVQDNFRDMRVVKP